jgi:hypothetical protein
LTTELEAPFAVTSLSRTSASIVIRYVLENCAALQRIEVVESSAVVAVRVRETRTERLGVSCVASLAIRTARVELRAPLGNRQITGQCTTGDICQRIRHPYPTATPS